MHFLTIFKRVFNYCQTSVLSLPIGQLSGSQSLQALHPSWTSSLTTGTRPPSCLTPQQPTIYITRFPYEITNICSSSGWFTPGTALLRTYWSLFGQVLNIVSNQSSWLSLNPSAESRAQYLYLTKLYLLHTTY